MVEIKHEPDISKCRECKLDPNREDPNGPCEYIYHYVCEATNGKEKR